MLINHKKVAYADIFLRPRYHVVFFDADHKEIGRRYDGRIKGCLNRFGVLCFVHFL